MSFPQVIDVDSKSGTVTGNDATWDLTYPTGLASGDLILAMIASDGDVTSTWPAGWVRWRQRAGTAVSLILAAKVSDGTETGVFTVTLSGSEQGGWRVIRLTGAFATSSADLPTAEDDGDVTTAINGTAASLVGAVVVTATPNPPALDPSNWGVEDTLWFALIAVDTSRTISDWPDGTTDNGSLVSGGSGGATLAWARLESAAGSWDPTTFTTSASDDVAVITAAIRPAAPPVPRVPYVNRMPQLLAH